MATALATLMSLPSVALVTDRSPVMRLQRFEAALGPRAPRVFIKRDDLLTFGLGGNKVRKLQFFAAAIAAAGADTVITCGALQSNHARVTAATGATLGWRVVLVLSGTPPSEPTGNLRWDHLFGADVRFVADRADRNPMMEAIAGEVRQAGHRPFILPVGGSTPLGAAAMARAVAELGAAGLRPDAIVHASSSGGTQAGFIAGCALLGLPTRVLGVSADETARTLTERIEDLLDGLAALLGGKRASVRGPHPIDVDDSQVGDGYGVPSAASIEATSLLARSEGIVVDSVYSAKALAGLVALVRSGRLEPRETVLFWQTGGPL
jgi:1-aminocyclopropane-1-carboxylate deaminase/D-cysteine desulfhydrase-like pyridoxal-dependent ACC family enzyme